MTATFDLFAAEQRRLAVLRILAEAPEYAHNEAVLRAALDALGHAVAADLLRADLDMLADAGAIVVEDVAGIHVARLTVRGADAASGRARIDGVARPSPLARAGKTPA